MSSIVSRTFPSLCRRWRRFRKLSQLDLAPAADVSQRHLSWLETGRSLPSREMVLRLSDAMEIPLRERNVLLRAAGYAPVYDESRLDEPAMAPVLDALTRMLEHHEPLPAVVVDRMWNVKMQNRAAERLLAAGGDPARMMEELGGGEELNLALLCMHPGGLRRFITNWDEAGPFFARRLKNEALACGDAEVEEWFRRLLELAGPVADDAPVMERLLPVLPVELDIGGLRLGLFSVISTFGTPQDVTTDELRIESFYPADEHTDRFFRQSN